MSRPATLLSLLSMLLLLALPTVARAAEPVARGILFYSRSCSHCQTVLDEVLPPIQAKHGAGLEVRALEISDRANYDLLLQLEERYKPSKRELPVLMLGGRALAGEDEIRAGLEGLIADCLARGGCDYPSAGAQTPAVQAGQASIHLAYFYNRGCAECDRVSYDLEHAKARFPGLEVTAFDMALPESKALDEALCRRLGVPESQRLVAPAILVGDHYLVGPGLDATSLEAAVTRYASVGAPPVWGELGAERQAAAEGIAGRFRSFGIAPVLAAGLVDGLNPCAFATVIFFVSYLAVAGRKGREILSVGAAFTLGVFLSYLLIGLGILAAVRSLSFLVGLAKAVYLATAAVCLVLAVLNVRDYIRVRRGGLADMSLQLPGYLKERVRKTIRERARVRQFVAAAFVSGFLVALLELICTGQVYLPTIVFVVGVPELRAQATLYLLLYNLMFILPLVVVFALTYFGATSRDLTRFLQQRAGAIKLLLAAVFVALGGWLVYATL